MNKIFMVLSFLLVSTVLADASDSAFVSFVKGKVYVSSASKGKAKWKQIKKGDVINSGDTIKTGNGSMATLIYKESEFKIQPNSDLVIESLYKKNTDGKVKVEKGSAWFKIKNLGGSKFFSNTPVSVAAVRGTAFATTYSPKEKRSMNCVCEGSVEIQGKEVIRKGTGGMVVGGKPEIGKTSYKDLISKIENNGKTSVVAMPAFKDYVTKFPEMKSCLSCHTPKGWTWKGVAKDDKYGN
ncbi:MAG: FecR domain-containing protein [Leptospiraceae bacterium]|nr:FecR domain-containing protein [Leptospiraceae bacterium]MCP5496247.1 FecR domain-containing protein [Leptospiraceae bacterium]